MCSPATGSKQLCCFCQAIIVFGIIGEIFRPKECGDRIRLRCRFFNPAQASLKSRRAAGCKTFACKILRPALLYFFGKPLCGIIQWSTLHWLHLFSVYHGRSVFFIMSRRDTSRNQGDDFDLHFCKLYHFCPNRDLYASNSCQPHLNVSATTWMTTHWHHCLMRFLH